MVHNSQISIAKGIGISLMVIGHSGCPQYLHDFIYSFHMVLFYFLSGYFFRDSKIIGDGRLYLMRKMRGLYWPYVKWSVVFILFHNFFYRVGFNDAILSHQEMWINVKRSIRGLWQGEHFLGAYWFLISLLWVIILFSVIIWLKNKLHSPKLVPILVSVLFCMGFVSVQWGLGLWIKRELMVLPFFYLGYLVGNGQLKSLFHSKYDKQIAFLVCLPILMLIACFTHIAVGGNNYGPYYIYIVTSFCGIYLVFVVSKLFESTKVGSLLDFTGVNTLQIMTFHFFAFKLLTSLLIKLHGLPNNLLIKWPIPVELERYWVLYTIIGLLLPLGMNMFYNRIKWSIKSKFLEKSDL